MYIHGERERERERERKLALTHIPSLQSSHVDIPVQPEEHYVGEDKHPKHSKEANYNTKDHVEEQEHIRQDIE